MPVAFEEPSPRGGAIARSASQGPAPLQPSMTLHEAALRQAWTVQERVLRSASTVRSVVRSATDYVDQAVSGLEPELWTRNFHVMSICMGVSHAVEDLLFAYTTIVYRGGMGFNCNSVVFGVWALTSMTIASPVTARLGSKVAIVLGLALYMCQYVAFVVCSAMPDVWQMHALAYGGAVFCGLGAGLVWTAEGAFFAQSAQRIASATGEPLSAKSSGLAAVFGFWSLGAECLIKVGGFALQEAGVGMTATFAAALALALASTLAAAFGTLPVHAPAAVGSTDASNAAEPRRRGGGAGAVSLWLDARIWLLSFLTVGFALAVSFVNGIVSTEFVKPQLGEKYVALLSAGIALTGSALQGPLRCLAGKLGNGCNMVMASAVLALMPSIAFALDMRSLGWWLSVFYVLMGVVRAVWVSTNKAVLANHFPEPRTEAAFANMNMQAALAACAGFFVERRMPLDGYLVLMGGAACMVAPGYVAACRLQGEGKVGTSDSASSGVGRETRGADSNSRAEAGSGDCV